MALLTAATTLALIETFKEPILSACKDAKNEVQFFLDNGLPEYINSIKDKFQHTKTFLYRQENVNFYDIFFPVSIKIRNGAKVVTSCSELFKETNFVSIIGSAGCGKTMLMKHFFLESIKSKYKIPIFIELRDLNDFDGTLTELIYQEILNNRLSPDKRILERLLEGGSFILLLDGYDEIYSEKKNRVTSDLDKFIDRYSKNRFIISSRPGSGIDSMPRFNNYPVMPLKEKEIERFIDLVLKSIEDLELAPKIKMVINRPENKDYKNFLSSPLLLSMFILTFKQYPELPKKKSKFYWNVFDTLSSKHDSFTKKGGYQHERKSGLENDQFEIILQWLSYKSLFSGKINFDSQYLYTTIAQIKKELGMSFDTNLVIEDLTVAISIIIIDGIDYKFPHKSLQEYFAISLIKDLKTKDKEKIYQQQFATLARRSTEGSANLWALALEVDREDFNKFFVIKSLSDFIDIFHGLSEINKLKQFFDTWNQRENFIKIEDGQYLFTGNHIYTSWLSHYTALLQFVGINPLPMLRMVGFTYERNAVEFSEYLDTVVDNPDMFEDFNDPEAEDDHTGLYFSAKYHWNNKLESLFAKARTPAQFNNILIAIQGKIDLLKTEINEAESASSNLLVID